MTVTQTRCDGCGAVAPGPQAYPQWRHVVVSMRVMGLGGFHPDATDWQADLCPDCAVAFEVDAAALLAHWGTGGLRPQPPGEEARGWDARRPAGPHSGTPGR